MSRLNEILTYNESYVENKNYIGLEADKYPNKRILIVTCMDTRLIELLPQALNINNGDAKILKTAGALISYPYGSIMRSLVVAVSMLKADEVFVIGHTGCGMVGLKGEHVVKSLLEKGVPKENIERVTESGVVLSQWLLGCNTVEEGVRESIALIHKHPMVPKSILIHGLMIDSVTGKLDLIHDGREHATY